MRNQSRVTEEQEAPRRWTSFAAPPHWDLHTSKSTFTPLPKQLYIIAASGENTAAGWACLSSCHISLLFLFCSSDLMHWIFPILIHPSNFNDHAFSRLFFLLSPHYLPPRSLHRCSHRPERGRPGRAGWKSTPSRRIRASPRWSPVPLTSISPTATAASTSRHAASPRSHAMGNQRWAAQASAESWPLTSDQRDQRWEATWTNTWLLYFSSVCTKG